MNTFARRVLGSIGLGAAAFASGAAVDPASAGAHCGDHAGSCGLYWVVDYDWCDGTTRWEKWDGYDRNCAGTCYNSTQGCCTSPASCNDYPCAGSGASGAAGGPNRCGGPCAWADGFNSPTYNDPSCGY